MATKQIFEQESSTYFEPDRMQNSLIISNEVQLIFQMKSDVVPVCARYVR